MYSIKAEFSGSNVMITGGSGYIGSLLVEQLLRTTDVGKIWVLIRGKRGCTAQERLDKLLQSGLFHMVRDEPRLLDKVGLLEGDMNSDSLGLSASDLDILLTQVNIIIHSAASIELEADIQKTLSANYHGTRRLLALATRMQQLRSFVHVSTAYVNVNLPRGSAVDERIYPLYLGHQEVQHADVVEDLMSLDPTVANVRAQMYLDMWGFPNTYTLGKNLTEKMVACYHKAHALPIAIVRPSLVTGLAGAPYPGYCGNLAGPIGLGLAMAVGLFDRLDSVAMVPTHVWDAIPGDVVSSVILAAAAATAAGVKVSEYSSSSSSSSSDPMIIHAGSSTTYPISFAEAFQSGLGFVQQNPPPFKLPGAALFNLPLDYTPDVAAVARRKYWTAWKVWAAVKLLDYLGHHKTARQLKYGHIAWEISNNSKTDRNIFFGSRNLLKLESHLCPNDANSGDYTTSWTVRNGGWQRYIMTNLVGMYCQAFGMKNLKGVPASDFKFIPNRPVPSSTTDRPDTTASSSNPPAPSSDMSEIHELNNDDLVNTGFMGSAALVYQPATRDSCPGDIGAHRELEELPSDDCGSSTSSSSCFSTPVKCLVVAGGHHVLTTPDDDSSSSAARKLTHPVQRAKSMPTQSPLSTRARTVSGA